MNGKYSISMAALLLLGISAFSLLPGCSKAAKSDNYIFTEIARGNIENSVSSSGTLEPVGAIDVLSQMTGTVEKIYADYNDTVTKGMPLIDLNTDILKIQVRTAEASVTQSRATYEHNLLAYNNNLALRKKELISEFDLDESKTSLAISKAQLQSAEAQLEEMRIKLDQYALILSPISGVVLERNVDVGDTVVSGTSATSLFVLAKDLTQMEIHVLVDELDISNIREGQDVTFTVDAFPNDEFSGSVRQIRKTPQTTDNVVSYAVIVDAENPESKLLPGMTAEVDFLIEQKKDVFLVSNAALRFTPPAAEDDSGKTQQRALLGGIGGPGFGPPPGSDRSSRKTGGTAANGQTGVPPADNMKTLWYVDDSGALKALPVRTGISDGVRTEVESREQLEGRKVIAKLKVE